MNRRTLVLALAACMPLTHALAQNAYPQKPVKLIVPYAPGGSADIAARLVSEEWGKALGQSLVIDHQESHDFKSLILLNIFITHGPHYTLHYTHRRSIAMEEAHASAGTG